MPVLPPNIAGGLAGDGGSAGGGGGLETYTLPRRTIARLARQTVTSVTWTLAQLQAAHASFTAPVGALLSARFNAPHAILVIDHVAWDTARNQLNIQVRNVTLSAANNLTVDATLTVLRGAGGSGANVQSLVGQAVAAHQRLSNAHHEPPGADDLLPAYNQAETQALLSRAGLLFWQLLNQVPDTPGDASGVGHVLTVTGQNDQDYAWREFPHDESDHNLIHNVNIALNNHIADLHNTDGTARANAAAALAAANAAQLDTDTVIVAGPPFVARDTTQRNVYVYIAHPRNAYPNANIISVRVQGGAPNLQAYLHSELRQTVTVGVTALEMRNIDNSNNLNIGNYINIEVTLTQGRNGPVQFFRNVPVPVVTA